VFAAVTASRSEQRPSEGLTVSAVVVTGIVAAPAGTARARRAATTASGIVAREVIFGT
jgi:hypothetical protein